MENNIKDLFVIDVKIFDDRLKSLKKEILRLGKEMPKHKGKESEFSRVINLHQCAISELENLKQSLHPLEPIASDIFRLGAYNGCYYGNDSGKNIDESETELLNNINLNK
tara:strand:- start:422 stop:751 length:330 start_codon:yes stop_codon:yes gene_type:complete